MRVGLFPSLLLSFGCWRMCLCRGGSWTVPGLKCDFQNVGEHLFSVWGLLLGHFVVSVPSHALSLLAGHSRYAACSFCPACFHILFVSFPVSSGFFSPQLFPFRRYPWCLFCSCLRTFWCIFLSKNFPLLFLISYIIQMSFQMCTWSNMSFPLNCLS